MKIIKQEGNINEKVFAFYQNLVCSHSGCNQRAVYLPICINTGVCAVRIYGTDFKNGEFYSGPQDPSGTEGWGHCGIPVWWESNG